MELKQKDIDSMTWKKAKVFYSRDVIFNESECAVEEPERDKEGAAKHYVEFDCQEPDKEDSTNSTACQNTTRNNSTEQELQKLERTSQVKSSHLYLYSTFNNTNCKKALHSIKIGKLCQ